MANQETRPALERHIQTGIAAVLVGLVGWIGVSITGMSESVARLEVKQEIMQRDIDKLSEAIDNGMLPQTALELRGIHDQLDEHDKYLDTIWPRLREMKERIQALEPKDADRWQY